MKKLIAAAVAAAVIVPAIAMADSTLYGKLHMSVGYADNDEQTAGVKDYQEINLASNSSRIGVKGSEDLGNGLKLGYLIEWQVGMDGGAGDLNTRNRYLTVGGGFGTILLGKVDTPMKTLGRKVDLFGERAGDTRRLTNANSYTDARAENAMAYLSPDFAGFNVVAAYVTDTLSSAGVGDNLGDNNNFDAFSGSAIYSNGPILVGGAYTQYGLSDLSAVAKDEKDWRLAGSFKMGPAKIVASYTDVESGKSTKNNDYSVWQIGAGFDFGSNTIKAQYSDKSGSDLRDITGAKIKDGANVWAIGFEHKMSKRTMVYADYGQLDNDKGSNLSVLGGIGNGSGIPTGGADSTPKSFALGIIHNF